MEISGTILNMKKPWNHCVPTVSGFLLLVETAGLEPVTSCVWRYVEALKILVYKAFRRFCGLSVLRTVHCVRWIVPAPLPVWVRMWVRVLEATSQNDYTITKERLNHGYRRRIDWQVFPRSGWWSSLFAESHDDRYYAQKSKLSDNGGVY